MITFLIACLLLSQVFAYIIIGYIINNTKKTYLEIIEKIADTYMRKIDKEEEVLRSLPDEVDPIEVKELSPEEEFNLRLKNNGEKQ